MIGNLRSKAAGCALALAIVLAGLAGPASSAAAAGSPRWQVSSVAKPTNFAPLSFTGEDSYEINVTNVGDAATDGSPITVTDTLPPAVTAKKVEFFAYGYKGINLLSGADIGPSICTGTTVVKCVYPGSTESPSVLPHGEELLVRIKVEVHRSKLGSLTNSVTVTGGGAPSASDSSTNEITAGGSAAPFGAQNFEFSDFAADGTPSTQAGSRPYELTTTILLNDEVYAHEEAIGGDYRYVPTEDPNDIVTELPPGLIGNPRAVPKCSIAHFADRKCPIDSQVGTAFVELNVGERLELHAYNVEASHGQIAVIGLEAEFGPQPLLIPTLRTGGDYGLRITSVNTPVLGIEYIKVIVWGVPANPSHDFWRGRHCGNIGCSGGGLPSGLAEERPFLTNPTYCSGAELPASLAVDSWEKPGEFVHAATTIPAMTGCNQVQFEPTIEARPTTNVADAPSGLNVQLEVPQNESAEGLATSTLHEAKVALPPGMVVNPASADGLEACTEAQIDLSGEGPAHCPDASKLGNVTVETPLIDHPLPGAVYIAKQGENPFHSLLALYIAIEDPQTGIIVKLAGKVTPDPATGQLTTTFEENPQLPFERFQLHFFPGGKGALRTPATCGKYTTASELTPWSAPESGPPASPQDEFEVTTGPNGGACVQAASAEPHSPLFRAGTESPQAGVYSPLGLRLARDDGSQELKAIDVTLPPGLTGKLAGVSECSDAQLAVAESRAKAGEGAIEQSAPSCPANSEVGSVVVGAGAGPDPVYVTGHAYLAGPYRGAPLSLAIVTPAVTGPFDLGTVVVRSALEVDPETAQITAKSDPIPTILDGIPLDVRSVTLKMNRPSFTLNPTSCNEMGFGGSAVSVLGQSAPLTQRFQVGGCAALPFKPKLSLRLRGGTKRSKFPALTATLRMPPGSANVAAAQVTLPHSAFLANAHIDKTCGRPELAAHTCPASSIYGHAIAETPLLDHPLEGPVYLATGFGYKLPALVADLNGQIEVLLKGKVDTGREDGIRNTFELVPDAPVSRFTLQMLGGSKGLIENHENLCAKHAKRKALARFTGQNGTIVEMEPTVANSCKRHSKKGKHGASHKRRGRALLAGLRAW